MYLYAGTVRDGSGRAGYIIEKTFDFETKLVDYELSEAEKEEADRTADLNQAVTLEELKQKSPAYPLCAYMEKYGWADSERFCLQEPMWLEGLNELYIQEN